MMCLRPYLPRIPRVVHGLLAILVAVAGTAPASAAQTHQRVGADSTAVLTVPALTQLEQFWAAFVTEPDSIRSLAIDTWGTATSLVAIDTVYTGGRIDRTEWVHNMPALATRYPAVAADLHRAGLTPQRYTALLATLLNTCRMASVMLGVGNPRSPTPLEAQNVRVLTAHAHIRTILANVGAGQFRSPVLFGVGDCGLGLERQFAP